MSKNTLAKQASAATAQAEKLQQKLDEQRLSKQVAIAAHIDKYVNLHLNSNSRKALPYTVEISSDAQGSESVTIQFTKYWTGENNHAVDGTLGLGKFPAENHRAEFEPIRFNVVIDSLTKAGYKVAVTSGESGTSVTIPTTDKKKNRDLYDDLDTLFAGVAHIKEELAALNSGTLLTEETFVQKAAGSRKKSPAAAK